MRPNEKLPMKYTRVNHVTLGKHSSECGLHENYIIEGPLTQHPWTHHPHALSSSSGVTVTLPNFTNHLVVSSSPSHITGRAVFFLRIFVCSQSGNHPLDDLDLAINQIWSTKLWSSCYIFNHTLKTKYRNLMIFTIHFWTTLLVIENLQNQPIFSLSIF